MDLDAIEYFINRYKSNEINIDKKGNLKNRKKHSHVQTKTKSPINDNEQYDEYFYGTMLGKI